MTSLNEAHPGEIAAASKPSTTPSPGPRRRVPVPSQTLGVEPSDPPVPAPPVPTVVLPVVVLPVVVLPVVVVPVVPEVVVLPAPPEFSDVVAVVLGVSEPDEHATVSAMPATSNEISAQF